MPIANTVEANIVINFEDRFTGPSQKAFEQYRRHAESIFRTVCASGVAAFEKIRAAQEAAFSIPQNGLSGLSNRLFEAIKGFLAVLTLFALPLENIRNNFELFRKGFIRFLQALNNFRLVLPFIAAGFALLTPVLAPAAILFAKVAAAATLLFLAWKAFEGIKMLLLEVKFKDEASVRANLLRKQLESTFRDPIIQEIQILRKNLDGPAGPFSGVGGQALDDGQITLRRNSPLSSPLGLNLDPQFEVPSFSSGIRFVPRDMLAQIHKGETVLPRGQAERFRQGGGGGDNITFQITSNFTPDQATARKFARMIEDERRRIDERRSI